MAASNRGRSPAATGHLQADKKIGSRSPSSNNAFPPSQSTIDPSLFGASEQDIFDFTSASTGQPHQSQQQQQFPQSSQFDSAGVQDGPYFDSNASYSDFLPAANALNQTGSVFDSSLYATQQQQDQSVDPSNLGGMAAVHGQPPQAPHFLSSDMQHHSNSSTHSTPAIQQNGQFDASFQEDNRRTSLDPSSAYRLSGSGGDWSATQFQRYQHHRSASDQYSDISSNQPSPNPENDSFDHPVIHSNSHSPLFAPQQDSGNVPNALAFEQFSLNDGGPQMGAYSPGHSSHPSPNLHPVQQTLPQFGNDSHFDMLSNDRNFNGSSMMNDGMMFASSQGEAFPNVSGQASPAFDQENLSPPEINVEFAPDRPYNPGDPLGAGNSSDALSPPERSFNKNRSRAISDPHHSRGGSRSVSPMRARSPSLGVQAGPGSLTPYSMSRSSSPGVTTKSNGITKNRRNSSPDRARVLALADPSRVEVTDANTPNFAAEGAASTGSDTNRKVQKHPATFQCSLCPKRFTRAYNLRSHLRTHTDERPFVCGVCGKAFARQHDRKRHEGLHTGEKKFVCRGTCSGPTGEPMTWGCNRRFARADALGRHFKSENGRSCIKPLMDEEARERQAAQMEQANHDMMNAGMQPGPGQPQQASQNLPLSVNGMPLPAALLAQYPALAEIQWSAMPGPGVQGGDDDFDASPRSSFELSSSGEYDFEEDGYLSGEGSGWDSVPSQSTQQQQQWSGTQ